MKNIRPTTNDQAELNLMQNNYDLPWSVSTQENMESEKPIQ